MHATRRRSLATHDLAPLPTAHQGDVAGRRRRSGASQAETAGDGAQGIPLTLPSYGGCGQPYLPIGAEVRIASRDEINLNTNTLRAAPRDAVCRLLHAALTDPRLERRQRQQPDSDRRRRLTGGCGNEHRRVLRHAARRARPTAASARMCTSTGATGTTADLNVPANFTVTVNGVAATLQGSLSGQAERSRPCTVPGNALTANPAPTRHRVGQLGRQRQRRTAGTTCAGNNCERRQQPCQYSERSRPTGRSSARTGTAGAVAFVRTSAAPWNGTTSQPGDPYATERDRRQPVTLFPTIGIRSVLRTGVYTTLRLDDPQANQTLRCDPNFAQGQEFSAFRYGCQPWYGENHFDGDSPRPAEQHGLVVEPATSVPAGRPVVLLRRPGRGLRRQLGQQPLALRADRPRPLDRPDRRRHRRGDRQLRQHPDQLVPEASTATTTATTTGSCGWRPAASAAPPRRTR